MAIGRISRSHVKLRNNGKLDRVRSSIRVTYVVVLSKRYIFFKRRRHWSFTFAFSPVVRLEAKAQQQQHQLSHSGVLRGR